MSNSKKKGLVSRKLKLTSGFLALSLVAQVFYPSVGLALTSGPSQPEFSSFEQASASNMVDLHSGNFSYNIPLLTVPGPNGGYPINLSYQSGISMEQEASWVGLGWNLNVGAVNRQLRGVPDDFKGDKVSTDAHMRPSKSYSYKFPKKTVEQYGFQSKKELREVKNDLGVVKELVSFEQLDQLSSESSRFSFFGSYNNYSGYGVNISYDAVKDKKGSDNKKGIDLSFSASNSGLGFSGNLGINDLFKGVGLGFNFNSRSGLQNISYWGPVASKKRRPKSMLGSITFRAGLSFGGLNTGLNQDLEMINESYQASLVLGKVTDPIKGEFTGRDYGQISYSESKIRTPHVSEPAYGYMYTSNNSGDNAKLDFMRESDSYDKKQPYLLPSEYTYDIFSYSGQGTGSYLRAHRANVDVLSKSRRKSKSHNIGARLEASKSFDTEAKLDPPKIPFINPLPTMRHVGGSVDFSIEGYSKSGDWLNGTDGFGLNEQRSQGDDEKPYYFKSHGEMVSMNSDEQNFYEQWGGEDPVKFDLEENLVLVGDFEVTNEVIQGKTGESSKPLSPAMKGLRGRPSVATSVDILTKEEAKRYGFTRKDRNFDSSPGLAHHISEFSVLQANGMRYIYGQPVYNLEQEDHQYSLHTSAIEQTYSNGQLIDLGDDLESNSQSLYNKSKRQYKKVEKVAPYATSWLLSYVVSADYVDVDNNGPTENDFGYWVKFNYKKSSATYKWRAPYQGAQFSEATESTHSDHMASFSYGVKELYYLEAIETKTHIAEFERTTRSDGLEAFDRFSSRTSFAGMTPLEVSDRKNLMSKQQQLNKIKLYSKAQFSKGATTPTPLQTVHLDHNYSLGTAVPNNKEGEGKLTLNKVWTTYGTSKLGELTPYEFSYDNSKQYEYGKTDRWGYYNNREHVKNIYTDQRDSYIPSHWSLTEIKLPTKGRVKVTYESDDYAFEENHPALRMFDLCGLGNEDSTTPNDLSGSGTTYGGSKKAFKIWFPLEKTYTGSDADAADYILNHYLKGENGSVLEKVWVRANVMLRSSSPNDFTDDVEGFLEVVDDFSVSDKSELFGVNTYNNVGYISVKGVKLSNRSTGAGNYHPLRKLAFQHIQMNRPDLAKDIFPIDGYDDSKFQNGGLKSLGAALANMVGSLGDLVGMLIGYNQWALVSGMASEIRFKELKGGVVVQRSWLRLSEPDGKKKGGGLRVKRVEMSDQWSNLNPSEAGYSDSKDAVWYGQEYDYTTVENGERISSGVAYEPQMGFEESALYNHLANYRNIFPLTSPHNINMTTPLAKRFYPGGRVGYSKVTVRSIAPEQAKHKYEEVASNSDKSNWTTVAPVSVNEFYTGRDFPIKVKMTELDYDRQYNNDLPLPTPYGKLHVRNFARSMGYSVIIPKIHGRPKKMSSYERSKFDETSLDPLAGLGEFIGSTEYFYHTKHADLGEPNELSNVASVFTEEGKIKKSYLGIEQEIFVDRHEFKEKNFDIDFGLNVKLNKSGTPPVILHPDIPYVSIYKSSFKRIAVMKITQKQPILKRVEIVTKTSKVSTENLAYDGVTGGVLLTKTSNEFEDPVYSQQYPAHWYYELTGKADNVGVKYSNLNYSNGKVEGVDANLFHKGDELYVIFEGGDQDRFWVYDIVGGKIDIMNEYGLRPVGGLIESLEVIRSGKRNLLGTMVGGTSFTELTNGFSEFYGHESSGVVNIGFNKEKVLSSSAVSIIDEQSKPCIRDCSHPVNGTDNPYVSGERGIWRPTRSYAYRTDRDYVKDQNVRKDGYYHEFSIFPWNEDVSEMENDLSQGSAVNWIGMGDITRYSPYGFELENRDPLGVYSSAKYGYNNSLVQSVANNARYNEFISEDFEYESSDDECVETGLDSQQGINKNHAHTGSRSVSVGSGESITVKTVEIEH